MYDIAIIGGGIAGLTSALYGARAGKKVVVFEALSLGGQILNANDIENFPGFLSIRGYELIDNIKKQLSNYSNVEIVYEKINNIIKKEKIILNNKYETKTLIMATGLRKRPLGLYAENDFIGKGISYCATCDGNFYKDKDVAIVGGGNTALSDALYLSDICKKVYIIHRRDTFSADDVIINKVINKNNIEIFYSSEVVSLNGNEYLESVNIKSVDNEFELKISGLFIAIGQIPDNLPFSSIVNLNENGYIISHDCKTNVENIFVAGDCRTKGMHQLITASADGAIAANLAIQYLNKN